MLISPWIPKGTVFQVWYNQMLWSFLTIPGN